MDHLQRQIAQKQTLERAAHQRLVLRWQGCQRGLVRLLVLADRRGQGPQMILNAQMAVLMPLRLTAQKMVWLLLLIGQKPVQTLQLADQMLV